MSEIFIKSAVTDRTLLQEFKKMAAEQPTFNGVTFDEVYMLQKGKEKFIIGQKKTTDRVEGKYIDPHLESQALYFMAPLKNGKLQPATIIAARSHEKYDWDAGKRWGTHPADTSIVISRNNQEIYRIATQQYTPLDNLDVIKGVISEHQKISNQLRYEKSFAGKVTKLTKDTSQKISHQAKKLKQKSLKDKFLIAAAALTPVALTAAAPEAVLAALGGPALVATSGALLAGTVTVAVAGMYYTEELYNKIKRFSKDVKEKGIRTIAQTKIQEAKKRMDNRRKEQAKEKKLSHKEALTWLAVAEPAQVVNGNQNSRKPQRELL